MADRTLTIGTGKDYTTIAGWEAVVNRTTYDDEYGQIQENKNFAENVTINPATGNGGRVVLTVADAYAHDGTKASGARNVVASGAAIRVQTVDVTIEKLEASASASAAFECSVGYDGILIDRCIAYDSYSGFYLRPDAGEENNVTNCFAFDCTYNGFYFQFTDGGTIYASYCTAYNNDKGFRNRHTHASKVAYANGCVALGNTTNQDWYLEDSGTWTGGDYNVSGTSSDSSCPGANSDEGNETASGYFTDISTPTDPDLHKASGKDGSLDGGPTTGLGTYWPGGDIDGDTRSDWDLGADEIAAGAGGVTAGPLVNSIRLKSLVGGGLVG